MVLSLGLRLGLGLGLALAPVPASLPTGRGKDTTRKAHAHEQPPVVAAKARPPRSFEALLRPRLQPTGYADGLARPRALAFDEHEGVLYVALSTADAIAVVDPGSSQGQAPHLLAVVPSCAFPQALAALPAGGALVACRDDPTLQRLSRQDATTWTSSAAATLPTSSTRAVSISPDGTSAYLASPAARGVYVLSLARAGALVQTRETGLGARGLTWVPPATLPGQTAPLVLVNNFIAHTVTVHEVGADGRLSAARQTITTAAPALVVGLVKERGELWLATHEDRPLSRAHGPVEGLDSGVLRFPFADRADVVRGTFFRDPSSRAFDNFSERRPGPVVELAALAVGTEHVAVLGAGTDNVWLGRLETRAQDVDAAHAVDAGSARAVGQHPFDVVALPGDRFVTADRLSDTLSFVSGRDGDPGVSVSLAGLGGARFSGASAWTREVREGERLFFSTALVPRNVADGALSLYTCAACHDEGRIDGRRHPSKKNRFFSMTKTCVGLASTPPFLSLGEPATLEAFADNIVGTHAQGAERDPDHFDEYPVDLPMQEGTRTETRHLSPADVRAALAAYMASVPPAPSPFVAPGRTSLSAEEARGLALFRDGCAGCHQLVGSTAHANPVPPAERAHLLLRGQVALTSPHLYDVGTPVLGTGGNNPPSLRGVWEAAPYFSDGSARDLDEVIVRSNPDAARVHAPENARAPRYDAAARAALRAFLLTL